MEDEFIYLQACYLNLFFNFIITQLYDNSLTSSPHVYSYLPYYWSQWIVHFCLLSFHSAHHTTSSFCLVPLLLLISYHYFLCLVISCHYFLFLITSFYYLSLLLISCHHYCFSFQDLSFEAEFTIVAKRNDFCHAFVAYFECGFTQVKTEKNPFQGILHDFSCIYLNISIFILLSPSVSPLVFIFFLSLLLSHFPYFLSVCLPFLLLLARLSPPLSFSFFSFSTLLTHIDGRAPSLLWRDAQRIILLWNSKHKNHHTGNNTGSD